MAAAGNFPLGGNGVADGLYYHLWCKDEMESGPRIHIPDTIIYRFRQPAFWFFTAKDGSIKKKSKYNVVNARIEEDFVRKSAGMDIVAYYIAKPDNPDEKATIEYFDAAGLHEFLASREKAPSGILQRFIEPKDNRNAIVRAIWSPKICLLERRVNVRKLYDKRYSLYERAVTYEGTELNSITEPVRGAMLPAEVNRVCEQLVKHVAEVSFRKYQIDRMVANFKVDSADRVWFLWCSSLRLAEPAPRARSPSGSLSPHSRASPRHRSVSIADTGMADSVSGGGNPLNIDSALRVPDRVRLGPLPAPASPASDSHQHICLSCGHRVEADKLHDVPYKTVAWHHEQVVAGLRECGSRAWPPPAKALQAAGGIGFGGEQQRQALAQADPEIPFLIQQLHPRLPVAEYRRYRRDPLFLYKNVSVCEVCFLGYADVANSGLVTQFVVTALRARSPLMSPAESRADRARRRALAEQDSLAWTLAGSSTTSALGLPLARKPRRKSASAASLQATGGVAALDRLLQRPALPAPATAASAADLLRSRSAGAALGVARAAQFDTAVQQQQAAFLHGLTMPAMRPTSDAAGHAGGEEEEEEEEEEEGQGADALGASAPMGGLFAHPLMHMAPGSRLPAIPSASAPALPAASGGSRRARRRSPRHPQQAQHLGGDAPAVPLSAMPSVASLPPHPLAPQPRPRGNPYLVDQRREIVEPVRRPRVRHSTRRSSPTHGAADEGADVRFSDSATHHRDFLLRTLEDVRQQLAYPSTLLQAQDDMAEDDDAPPPSVSPVVSPQRGYRAAASPGAASASSPAATASRSPAVSPAASSAASSAASAAAIDRAAASRTSAAPASQAKAAPAPSHATAEVVSVPVPGAVEGEKLYAGGCQVQDAYVLLSLTRLPADSGDCDVVVEVYDSADLQRSAARIPRAHFRRVCRVDPPELTRMNAPSAVNKLVEHLHLRPQPGSAPLLEMVA